MRTDDPRYPYKRNPLRFEDVALACSIRWCVNEATALKYLRGEFNDPGDALAHLSQNLSGPPDKFWATL